MEINISTSIQDMDQFYQKTFGYSLNSDQKFRIRKLKIIKHLNDWKSTSPLEYAMFKHISWSSYSTERTSVLEIVFDNIIIIFGKYFQSYSCYINVSQSTIRNKHTFKITPNGIIENLNDFNPSKQSKEIINKLLQFLHLTHLVDENGQFLNSIWN